MKKLISLILMLLMSGCASAKGSYFPALGNAKAYNKCSPVYGRHTPPDVAKLDLIADMIKKNPSILEKALPAGSIIDVVGRNAPAIGTGLAATVSAIKGDISIASIVGSTVMGAVSSLASARSESKDQARLDACMPDDAQYMEYKEDGASMTIIKGANQELVDAINAIKNVKVKTNA